MRTDKHSLPLRGKTKKKTKTVVQAIPSKTELAKLKILRGYGVKDLERYLEKIKKNIQVFESAIEKEKKEIERVKDMIKVLKDDIKRAESLEKIAK